MTSYIAGLRAMPAARLPLVLVVALLLFLLYPRVLANPSLRWTFVGVAAALLAWHARVVVSAVRARRSLGFDVVIRRAHYMQPFFQGSIYAYWGWYWPEVYPYVPFVAAQLVFLYAFDMLLSWSRRDTYVLGFGPFPIIFSTNLFLWFKPDWFYLQFLLVAAGSLGKEFIRWTRDGHRTHIFNPSAFSLSLFSLILILTGTTYLTWGPDIAQTQQSPPYIYHWLFAVSLVASTFFRVTLLTVSAASSLVLLNVVYTAATGSYLFIDTSIPAAVFLGMILLMTDPSTTPRSDLGKVIFGSLYGISAFVLYVVLDAIGAPTFYDKLLAVPALNLSVKAIDRFASGSRWADLALPFTAVRRNALYVVLWFPIFGTMLATGAVGKEHEGRHPEFWTRACEQNLPRGCHSLFIVHSDRCDERHSFSCNEVGMMLTEGRIVASDQRLALESFERACELGFAPACSNVDAVRAGRKEVSREAARAGDLLRVMQAQVERDRAAVGSLDEACNKGRAAACGELGNLYLRGPEGVADYAKAAAALRKGCDANDPASCANLGLMHRRGAGMPADAAKARELLERACSLGLSQACKWVNDTN